MSTITMFGIPNCNSIKKARTWLTEQDITFSFHDYKKQGIDEARLSSWCQQTGFQVLLNTRGTTWRKLSDADKADMNETKAISLMAAHPSLIKRPVLALGNGTLLVGFKEADYQAAFSN
ncbi:MAG: arsenate reductase [Zetaproteobacteria bacterium CG2_30_46_52]|nr:MAG: arsenate reductase [Zetaproteobacteria bacterium CG2_30_46_52]